MSSLPFAVAVTFFGMTLTFLGVVLGAYQGSPGGVGVLVLGFALLFLGLRMQIAARGGR